MIMMLDIKDKFPVNLTLAHNHSFNIIHCYGIVKQRCNMFRHEIVSDSLDTNCNIYLSSMYTLYVVVNIQQMF